MNQQEKNKRMYLEAQKKVSKLRIFYVHLAGYLVMAGFIIWNNIIIGDTKYTDAILAINYSTLFVWGFFVLLHGIRVFKSDFIFNKKWEEKNLKEFMGDDHKKWE